MPPKNTRSTRASTRRSGQHSPPPPSSQDAKPNVDQLNAQVEAELEAQAAPPSDPSIPTSEPPQLESDYQPQPPSDPQPEVLPVIPAEPQLDDGDQPISEASTLTAPPVTRLNSLGASRGRGRGRGNGPVATPRFAGRRSQAKREQVEKEEQKRREDEAKTVEEAARAKIEAESRQASGRGRGRGRGRGKGPVASGPFSAGQVSKETQQLNKRWSSRGSGWKGYRVEGNKESSRGGRAKGKAGENADREIKPNLDPNGDVSMEDSDDDHEYDSSDNEELNGQRRMNVERLGVIDLTQDESDLNPFAPIRTSRVPHKERGFVVRDQQPIKQEEDAAVKVDTIEGDEVVPVSKTNVSQGTRGVEGTSEINRFQAVYSDSENDTWTRIKQEPGLEDNRSTNDAQGGAVSSPQKKFKGKGKVRAKSISSDSDGEYDEETEIDRDEEKRQRKDLALLRTEFGRADKDGDALMSDSDAAERRAEKVYLFQFPPLLPDLEPIFVKPEPDADNDGDLMQVDAPSSVSKPITINDDGKGDRPKLPSGAVGKMRVHASGKVTMDWGGMTLTLGVGGKAGFLQTVVAATFPDVKKDASADSASEETGQAINLGHVKEKFVVTPDWEELFG